MCKDQHGFTFKSNRGTSNSLKAASLILPFAPPWSEKAAGGSSKSVDQESSKSKAVPTADKVCVCTRVRVCSVCVHVCVYVVCVCVVCVHVCGVCTRVRVCSVCVHVRLRICVYAW